MRKKLLRAFACGAALLLCAGCSSKPAYKAGTYEGEAMGYNEEKAIRLSVTIAEDGSIYEIKLLQNEETPALGGKALEELSQKVIEKNSAKVDTISGATLTTEGFRKALEQALEKAEGK